MPPGKSAVAGTTRFVWRSSGRGGGRTTASNTLGSDHNARRRADSYRSASDHTQLLQTMERNLANLERNVEQLKASQQQMASDNSKAIEELKASQEEIKRVLARVSEQSPPNTSPPPTQPTSTVRKP